MNTNFTNRTTSTTLPKYLGHAGRPINFPDDTSSHTTPAIDYSIEHAKDIAAATAEMAVTTVKPTGKPLSLALVTAILEGKPSHLITLLGTQPDGVVNDRLNGKADGITPLHLAATLYANMRRGHRDLEAIKYDTICKALLQAGADPLARAYRPNDSTPYYPSEFTDGMTPPSLRRRMLLEADRDHLGWQPNNGVLKNILQAGRSTVQRLGRADTRAGRVNTRHSAG